jgi:hypothetical protein
MTFHACSLAHGLRENDFMFDFTPSSNKINIHQNLTTCLQVKSEKKMTTNKLRACTIYQFCLGKNGIKEV